jgi:long-subunit acyl-CoA synthetase (AMP-forming)
MTIPQLPDLQTLLSQIDEDFVQAELPGETDEDVAGAALDWILKRERVRYQVVNDAAKALKVDQLTVQKMLDWDSDDPEMSTIEKILRRLAEGRGLDAMALVGRLQIKAKAISEEMRRRASVSRKQHPVDELIEQLVRRDPTISEKLVLRKLESEVGGDVISAITDGGVIEPFNTDYPSLEVRGLKNRLSRIKKKISQ